MKNSFKPVNLQNASMHLDWLINKTKDYQEPQKKSIWKKILNILARVF